MCKDILIFLSNLYPFNKKITRASFLKYNFIFTILFGILFFSNIDYSLKVSAFSLFYILASPIMIYQWLSDENPLKYFGGFSLLCIATILTYCITIYFLITYL